MDPFDDPDAPWRSDPASEAQKRKLRFYDCQFSEDLTKGQASELIDGVMTRHPEREDVYQRWKQTEDELAEWYGEAINSNYYDGEDMRKPTREMVQETIGFLEATRPNWRDELRGDAFSLLLMEHYSQLKKQQP